MSNGLGVVTQTSIHITRKKIEADSAIWRCTKYTWVRQRRINNDGRTLTSFRYALSFNFSGKLILRKYPTFSMNLANQEI